MASCQIGFRAAVSTQSERSLVSKRHIMRGSQWTILVSSGRDFLIGMILLYGYVYTAYKYGNPLFGRNDFFATN
jgi:hypothetical protein